MLHFRAEVNPFFTLAGLQGESDAVAEDAPVEPLWGLLRADIGRPGTYDPVAFARDLQLRFRLQWPDRPLSLETISAALPEGPVDDRFHRTLLTRLGLEPGWYDLPPGPAPPSGPPGPVLEEPPLVCIQPWEPAAAMDRPLIIKTPSLAYRLPYLRRVFAGWRFRVLHLVRAAPDSINGLVDGWHYPSGFFSHKLQLDIGGYSDRHSYGQWWNFDLPPGWQRWTHRPLSQVCGFQWRSAHENILSFLETADVDSLRVRFEDLLDGQVQPVLDWLELDPEPALQAGLSAMPPVMATSPRARRWFDRAEELQPVLDREDTRWVQKRLGYAT
jgi:hypothetical protein